MSSITKFRTKIYRGVRKSKVHHRKSKKRINRKQRKTYKGGAREIQLSLCSELVPHPFGGHRECLRVGTPFMQLLPGDYVKIGHGPNSKKYNFFLPSMAEPPPVGWEDGAGNFGLYEDGSEQSGRRFDIGTARNGDYLYILEESPINDYKDRPRRRSPRRRSPRRRSPRTSPARTRRSPSV